MTALPQKTYLDSNLWYEPQDLRRQSSIIQSDIRIVNGNEAKVIDNFIFAICAIAFQNLLTV